MDKLCPQCNEKFSRPKSYSNKQWSIQTYCSRQCRGASDRTSVEKSCKQCGKTMLVEQNLIKTKKYCSNSCRIKGHNPVFTDESRKKISDAHMGKPKEYQVVSGDRHWAWKGGVGTERHAAMSRKQYKVWRTAVFERDNYTCQICEQYSGVLHADHIEKWSDNEELRYAVENGRTVCVACHYYITFKKIMKPGQRWCNFTARERG